VVGELIVAQAQLEQPAVADLPAVFDVLRTLFHAYRTTAVAAVLRHVVAGCATRVGTRCSNVRISAGHTDDRGARGALVVLPGIARIGHPVAVVVVLDGLVVDTSRKGMAAESIAQIETQV